MKRVLLTLSYDGTDYHGWQVQKNGITVQETVQNGIYKVLGRQTDLTGCSRTDAGVHANMFCCHLDCDDNIPESAFLRGLNSVLPRDIAVVDCRMVNDDFHARYDAKGKTYIYHIYNSSQKDPFRERFAWRIERELDTDKMNEFCRYLVGTHDFYGFSSSGRTVEDTVRTVTECSVEKAGDDVSLKITGNGFLYNMVRIITGTAVDVSNGRILPDVPKQIFTEKRRELAGVTAPPQGLFLEKVYY